MLEISDCYVCFDFNCACSELFGLFELLTCFIKIRPISNSDWLSREFAVFQAVFQDKLTFIVEIS